MEKIREGNQNQLVSGTLKWRIENFSKMDKEKLYSQVFVVSGSKWRILLCQGWKDTNLAEQLSLYLGVGDVSTLPKEWSRFAHFSMTLVNQRDTKNSKTWPPKGSVPQEFNEINSEWGFTSFMPISELYDKSAGYLVDDVCIVEANLNVPIKVEHQGTGISATIEFSYVNHEQALTSSAEPNAPCSELLFAPFQDAQGSGQVHTEPPVASRTDPSLARALGEVPNTTIEELVDFRGLGQIEKVFVPLLEGVCNSHPELIVCMHKRSQKYSECAFTALGRLLHFLKTTKVKDMTLDACNRLELLWEELESFKFDLAWLKPHVESAFDMTRFVHKAGRLKRLRDDVEALANELKRRRAALAATTIDHAVVKKHLTKAEQDINGIDMDGPLGEEKPDLRTRMNIKKAGEEIVSETFTWLIENFSKLQTGKHYSDVFTIAGFKCYFYYFSQDSRLLIWPKGNRVKSEMQFSVYLCAPIASTLEPGWARSADFSLSVVNQLDSTKTITKATKEFKENSREWGFKSFMPLSELYDISAGCLVNDTCIVEATLNVSIKTGDQGSNVSASLEHSGKELSTVNSVQAADSSPAAKTPRSEFQHTPPSSEKVCTTPADDGPTDPSCLGQIKKAFVPLLEEVCSLHPSLIECLHKRNRKVVECAFTALAGVLHFLKTAKVKDMTKDGSALLQSLWEDVQMFTFDLAWLEPHVRSALAMKQHLERARRVKRLREDMDLLGNELKGKCAAIAITEVDFKETKRDLEKEEEGFVAIDIDSQRGYGTH
ncbi:unnamed protein product [Malus baccata var. baccata]